MTPNDYLKELYAVAVGILYTPMVFYMFLRYKLGMENEQGKLFRMNYAEALKEPETRAAKVAAMAANIVLIDLIVFGYIFDSWVAFFLAGAIGFSLVVERLWRVEMGGEGPANPPR